MGDELREVTEFGAFVTVSLGLVRLTSSSIVARRCHDRTNAVDAPEEPGSYEILGVAPGASAADIHAGYRQAAKTFHSDTGGTSPEFTHLAIVATMMSGLRYRLKRLRRATHAPLLRYVVLPLFNREMRKGSVVLYQYVPEVDRLWPHRRFERFPTGRGISSDRWYRVLRDRGLRVDVIIDVGVNYGYTSVWMSAWAERVFAFEPNPDNAASIREHLAIRQVQNVELVESAVSDHTGRATLFVKPRAGHHSLADIGASETISTFEVAVTSLDAFCGERGIERVGLLKIDVEGFEPEVLRGAAGLLKRNAVGLLLFEYSPRFYRERGLDPLTPVDLLEGHGYRVTHLDGAPIERERLADSRQADLFATPGAGAPG